MAKSFFSGGRGVALSLALGLVCARMNVNDNPSEQILVGEQGQEIPSITLKKQPYSSKTKLNYKDKSDQKAYQEIVVKNDNQQQDETISNSSTVYGSQPESPNKSQNGLQRQTSILSEGINDPNEEFKEDAQQIKQNVDISQEVLPEQNNQIVDINQQDKAELEVLAENQHEDERDKDEQHDKITLVTPQKEEKEEEEYVDDIPETNQNQVDEKIAIRLQQDLSRQNGLPQNTEQKFDCDEINALVKLGVWLKQFKSSKPGDLLTDKEDAAEYIKQRASACMSIESVRKQINEVQKVINNHAELRQKAKLAEETRVYVENVKQKADLAKNELEQQQKAGKQALLEKQRLEQETKKEAERVKKTLLAQKQMDEANEKIKAAEATKSQTKPLPTVAANVEHICVANEKTKASLAESLAYACDCQEPSFFKLAGESKSSLVRNGKICHQLRWSGQSVEEMQLSWGKMGKDSKLVDSDLERQIPCARSGLVYYNPEEGSMDLSDVMSGPRKSALVDTKCKHKIQVRAHTQKPIYFPYFNVANIKSRDVSAYSLANIAEKHPFLTVQELRNMPQSDSQHDCIGAVLDKNLKLPLNAFCREHADCCKRVHWQQPCNLTNKDVERKGLDKVDMNVDNNRRSPLCLLAELDKPYDISEGLGKSGHRSEIMGQSEAYGFQCECTKIGGCENLLVYEDAERTEVAVYWAGNTENGKFMQLAATAGIKTFGITNRQIRADEFYQPLCNRSGLLVLRGNQGSSNNFVKFEFQDILDYKGTFTSSRRDRILPVLNPFLLHKEVRRVDRAVSTFHKGFRKLEISIEQTLEEYEELDKFVSLDYLMKLVVTLKAGGLTAAMAAQALKAAGQVSALSFLKTEFSEAIRAPELAEITKNLKEFSTRLAKSKRNQEMGKTNAVDTEEHEESIAKFLVQLQAKFQIAMKKTIDWKKVCSTTSSDPWHPLCSFLRVRPEAWSF
jgi:hypothetical protein